MGKVMGDIPFWYKRVGKDNMALDEHEAPISKMMYDLFLEHKRHATAANILNNKGYRTKRKSKFTGATVTTIIRLNRKRH
ncbi:recombinase family protein [Gaetbulibacter jejuensis]|uniref:Recombinase domain-containing protein n=1 Tax=Gaetbulibacter jejuensis TaxID=584607 RepID=A0ABN1JN48_9FLAO